MKLALSINCFDGIELLRYSLPKIRDHVDYIILNYQNISYFGIEPSKEYKEFTQNEIDCLFSKKLIDKLLIFNQFKPVRDPYEAKQIEKQKRQYCKDYLLFNCKEKYTHHIDIDCDEVYNSEQFYNAKQFIEKFNIPFSACKYNNYYWKNNSNNYEIKDSGENVVPFICILDEKYPIGNGSFLGKSDPTRSYMVEYNRAKHLFEPNDLLMHHFTNLRKDYNFKLQNTTLINKDKISRLNELENNGGLFNNPNSLEILEKI